MNRMLILMVAIVGNASVVCARPSEVTNSAEIASVKKFAREMGDAMVRADMRKLENIYANEWTGLSLSGRLLTIEEVMRQYQSGDNKLLSYTLGPIDVQVFGDIAISHGSVTEQRSWKGRPTWDGMFGLTL